MSGTARELTRRLRVLVALGLAATAALFFAYRGVHADAVPLSSSSTSGVLAVDTAKSALGQAKDVSGTVAEGDVTLGDFTLRISVANQSLALAAADGVTGLKGRQTLQTVTGLISVYANWVQNAAVEPIGSPLREAYLSYADDTLGDPAGAVTATGDNDYTVVGRLNALQRDQLRVVHRQAAFGPSLWFGWTAAGVLCAALLVALTEANSFARARFRRRWNRPLAGAFALLLAGAAVLAVFTWWTHDGMYHARGELSAPQDESGIPRAGSAVAHAMAGAGFRAAAAGWIVAGGVLLTGLIFAGLQPRINEYRVRTPR